MLNYVVLVLLCASIQAQLIDPVEMRNFSEMIDMQVKLQDAMIETLEQTFRTCTDLSRSMTDLTKNLREAFKKDSLVFLEMLQNLLGMKSQSPGEWMEKILISLEYFTAVFDGLAFFADYTMTTIASVGKVVTFSIGSTFKLLAEKLLKVMVTVAATVNFHSNPLNSHSSAMPPVVNTWRRVVKFISKDMLTSMNPYGPPTLIGFVPSVIVDFSYCWADFFVKLLKLLTRRIAMLERVVKEPLKAVTQAMHSIKSWSLLTLLSGINNIQNTTTFVLDQAKLLTTDVTDLVNKQLSFQNTGRRYTMHGLYTAMSAIKRIPDIMKESLTVFKMNETSTNFDVNKITSATEMRMRAVDRPFVTEMRKRLANETKQNCVEQISSGYHNEVQQRETNLAGCKTEYEDDKLGKVATDFSDSLLTGVMQTKIMATTLMNEPAGEWKQAVGDWLDVLNETRTAFRGVVKQYGAQMTPDNREDRFIKCLDRAVQMCRDEIISLKETYLKCISSG